MSNEASQTSHEDDVDRIVGAWEVQRPDLDTSPMLIFSRITRIARHLDLARRTAFSSHELEPWEFDVLSSLRRAGKPYALTPGNLMNELLVSSGTMTNRIDRLEAKGLVERSRSSTDRRAVLVTLTSNGKQKVDAALASLLDAERALLVSLTKRQRENLSKLLRPILLTFTPKTRH
ncbi:MarR family winged helix-turn-helix transcriptional regulator [Gleimia hominis]|uniref:MarR family winged helix-turn-helix transcriptional regulator n=1 Tax=Gleimia hominis TaxID=595468 RepID=UPI001E332967|nr:MarR family transcriptional regulator [Gleimia hominis]WIK64684.1 MarR family transcriptional regulator [Gleimia hominis]